jgi:HD-GYP domain-containing protein (c-di-GMP phosphodiesterase class II)
MNQVLSPLVESNSPVQALGRPLLSAMYAAAQAMKLYPLDNSATQNALRDLTEIAQRGAQREDVLELRVAGDFLFLNDSRLRLDLANYVVFSFLTTSLARHRIGSIEIAPGVTREEWVPFLSFLQGDADPEEPFERFVERLQNSPVRNIRVEPEKSHSSLDDDNRGKEAAKRAYAQSVQVARDVLTDVRLGKAVNVRRVKRAVQSIVDQVLTNETSIVGMTTLRDYDEYTFTHSVNVCIFSVVLGQKLGFSKAQLYELGLGALFHDIGKMRVNPELTSKTEELTPAELEQMRQHPIEGLISLFSMHGFGEVPYRAMLIAYEHHMKVDLTGYPPNERPRNPTMFPRIVAIADGFDAATSKRSYQSLPWRPEDVLHEMRDNPARGYDPLLVKAFINVTGIFPVGTLVILDTYELAVVISANPQRELIHQPIVRVIADSLGLPLAEPLVADLAEIDPATGSPRRTIIKTTDPERYGIRVADYFV